MPFDPSTATPVAEDAPFDPSTATAVADEPSTTDNQTAIKAPPDDDRKLLEELGINRGQGFAGARSDAQATGGSFQQKFVEPAAAATVEPSVKLPDIPDVGIPGTISGGVATGVMRGAKTTLESLTAPIGAVLAPLAEVKAVSPIAQSIVKAAEAYFAGETAKAGGAEAAKVVEAIKDPNATKADVAEHVVNATTALGFSTSLGVHATGVKLAGQPVKMDAIDEAGKPVQVELPADEAVRRIDEQAKADRASVYEQAGVKEEAPAPKMVDVPPAPAEPAFDPSSAKPVEGEFNPETAQPVQAEPTPAEPAPSSEVRFSVYREQKNAAGETQPGAVQLDRQQDETGKPMTDEQRGQFPSPEQILATDLPQGNYSLDEVNAAIEKKNQAAITDFGGPESDTYGIANRVNEARAKSGDIETVESGTSPGPEELVAQGRKLLREGETPDEAFTRALGIKDAGERIGFARAYGEQLFKKASDAADKFGTDSPEYAAAAKLDSDWVARIQPLKSDLARGFHALQGETEIDTGTFHGIRRAFQDLSGREFTPKEEVTAKKYVADQKEAQKAVDEIAPEFKKAIEDVVGPARKTVTQKVLSNLKDRYEAALERQKAKQGRVSAGLDPTDLKDYAEIGAYHLARGITDFAKWSEEMRVALGDAIRPHLEAIFGAAKKVYADAQKGELGNTVAGVYQRAKDYLDKGETNPSDVVAKIAADLGTTQADIWEKLATNKNVRAITDETFRRMAARRALTDAARNWIRDRSAPLAYRIATAPFRAGFRLATLGHGTVAPFTHSPTLGFNPGTFAIFWRNWARGFRLMGLRDAGAFHERVMNDLVRDPNYITARRAGLANEPHRAATDYEKAWMGGWLDKVGAIGNRGFDSLKLIRQDYFNQLWDKTAESQRTPLMAKLIADQVNHATGSVRAPYGPVTRALFFAPRLIASQFAHLVGDTAKAADAIRKGSNAAPEERAAAITHVKFLASVVGAYASALALNQGLLTASGSKQKINFTDPHQSDWLKFKAIGLNIAPVSGPLAMVRLLGNLLRIEFGTLEGAEKRGGKGEALFDAAKDFTRSKLSPTAGVLTDIVTGTDFQKRPLPFSKEKVPAYLRKEGIGKYTYGGYAATHLSPIPVSEAAREIWKQQGMGESRAGHLIRAILMGAEAATVGARVSPDYKVEGKK